MIRLAPRETAATSVEDAGEEEPGSARRGFDYESFEARLDSLWFQRKALLADGREADAAEQSELIRAFCREEGVRRVEDMAGALLAEADRFLEQDRYQRALDSLALAEAVDPGRPQIHMARGRIFWSAPGRTFAAAGELCRAVKSAFVRSIRDLSLANRLALLGVPAVSALLLVFSLLMVLRYQVPLRHEIEEWVVQRADERLAGPAGWAVLVLPFLLWFATGWAALFWVVISFRFMRRSERLAAFALLLAGVLALPAYRASVTVYGMTADPVVRTTLAAAKGEYDPDRILKLRNLVQAHPEDAQYRFLLAGLYKNGRFFEEAFAEYKAALRLDPTLAQAHINVGNIFYTTGQFAEAIANYTKALEVDSGSILAYFNMHLAQSDSFRFREAEESLQRARSLDSERLTELLAASSEGRDVPTVIDGQLETSSIWSAALGGTDVASGGPPGLPGSRRILSRFVNPISLAALATLLGCGVALWTTRRHGAARCCIRCGRPFCHHCKSGREGHEYCNQCLHLYVLGDGLAPETKTRKLFEVERYERWTRNARRLVSCLFPGAAQLLGGRAGRGCLLLLLWLVAIIAWRPSLLVPLERLVGADLRLDLLWTSSVPSHFAVSAMAALGALMALTVWILGNSWVVRRRGG